MRVSFGRIGSFVFLLLFKLFGVLFGPWILYLKLLHRAGKFWNAEMPSATYPHAKGTNSNINGLAAAHSDPPFSVHVFYSDVPHDGGLLLWAPRTTLPRAKDTQQVCA